MTEQLRIEGLAEEFWSLAGIAPDYPCDMEKAALAAFSLETVLIDALDIAKARAYAERHTFSFQFPAHNRQLRGCLLANARAGVMLIDASDSPEEQRYTIAHECAHFVLECWRPGWEAEAVLGGEIISVLEGRRAPTLNERLEALLSNLPLRLIGHLMERPLAGPPAMSVLDAENSADRLALELLAPFGHLVEYMRLPTAPCGYRRRCTYLISALRETYGIPEGIVTGYCKYILQSLGEPTFRDWLAEDF